MKKNNNKNKECGVYRGHEARRGKKTRRGRTRRRRTKKYD